VRVERESEERGWRCIAGFGFLESFWSIEWYARMCEKKM